MKKVLDPALFIDKSSSNLQMYLWNLIELVGLRRKPETRNAADKILTNVFSRISISGFKKKPDSELDSIMGKYAPNQLIKPSSFYLLPLDVLKNVLNMIPRKRTCSIVKKLVTILEENIKDCMQ